jgi:16S rRNA G527 N7-methylase RsmG
LRKLFPQPEITLCIFLIDMTDDRYYTHFAAAVVRGGLVRRGLTHTVESTLLTTDLYNLTQEQCEILMEVGREAEIKLYHFKRSDRMLPRVHKVLGFLKSIWFESLIDVGSGRGVFLLPFLETFPHVPVHSIEVWDKRATLLEDIAKGGVSRLTVTQDDVCTEDMGENVADVVTMLEVLEHIPDVEAAIRNAVRMARYYVVVTVPSKEDDNPEHIHLLTKDILTRLFTDAGCTRLHFGGVNGHLIMIASK